MRYRKDQPLIGSSSILSFSRGNGLAMALFALIAFPGCKLYCHFTGFGGTGLSVDSPAGPASDGNGVFEPGETAPIEPSWRYLDSFTRTSPATCPAKLLTGSASGFTGPGGAVYTIVNARADYGTLGAGQTHSCGSTGSCYLLEVGSTDPRPATHWDATFTETTGVPPASSILEAGFYVGVNLTDAPTITDSVKVWTLHIGESFGDVPRTNPFYTKIETLLHSGITAGCSATEYCPNDTLSRAQIAIFLARGIAKGGANVPETGLVNGVAYSCVDGGASLFADVAPTDSFCKHAHYLAALNVMTGCSPTSYCPNDTVSRLDMTESVARALVQPGGDDAVPVSGSFANGSYSCDAASPNLHFTDVSVSDSFCKHAHYLWARGIVAGCSATTFCTAGDVTRNAMAKFLVNAFGLKLYGP